MEGKLITRIAPTPSGYLHIGNAWSFVLTWLLARSGQGRIHLRIDDLDSDRFRPEYVEDIFHSLRWLGLDWDSGPRTAAEFFAQGGQRARWEHYAGTLQALLGHQLPARVPDSGFGGPIGADTETRAGEAPTLNAVDGLTPLLYACDCSRETVWRAAQALGRTGIYPGTCRHRNLTIKIGGKSGPTGVRVFVPKGATVRIRDFGGMEAKARPDLDMGDFLVWKKDGLPAYQLASVVDDDELGINHVVRGRDLLPSTVGQLYLAHCLGMSLTQTRFLHHGLFLDGRAEKISKSAQSAKGPGLFSLKTMSASENGLTCLLGLFGAKLGLCRMGERWTRGLSGLLEGFTYRCIPGADFHGEEFLREYPDWNAPLFRPG